MGKLQVGPLLGGDVSLSLRGHGIATVIVQHGVLRLRKLVPTSRRCTLSLFHPLAEQELTRAYIVAGSSDPDTECHPLR